MAFFASPLGGAVLNLGTNLLSGLFGSRSAKKQAARDYVIQQRRFVDLRAAAEAGGFNPLTALESGYQSPLSGGGGAPPLASTALVQSSLQGFADVFSGKAAQEMARDKLDLELGKLALETGRANLATLTRPSAVRAMPGGSTLGRNTTKVPNGSKVEVPTFTLGMPDFYNRPVPAPVLPEPEIVNTSETYTNDGKTTDVQVGPDPEEWFSGLFIEAQNRAKRDAGFVNSDEGQSGRAKRFPTAAMEWVDMPTRFRAGASGQPAIRVPAVRGWFSERTAYQMRSQ